MEDHDIQLKYHVVIIVVFSDRLQTEVFDS